MPDFFYLKCTKIQFWRWEPTALVSPRSVAGFGEKEERWEMGGKRHVTGREQGNGVEEWEREMEGGKN